MGERKLPEGYELIKHDPWTYQWKSPDGRTGFKNWDRNLVIFSAMQDAGIK